MNAAVTWRDIVRSGLVIATMATCACQEVQSPRPPEATPPGAIVSGREVDVDAIGADVGSDDNPEARTPRRGMVAMLFDDAVYSHYDIVFPTLKSYGLKASFGIISGKLGTGVYMTPAQVQEIYQAGHEILDHTFLHDAQFWSNPDNQPEFEARYQQSIDRFAELGIPHPRGWDQPGIGYCDEVYPLIEEHYDYAILTGLGGFRKKNFHWNFIDDPIKAGRYVDSWGMNGGGGDPEQEAANIIAMMATAVAQGVTVVPAFHHVKEYDGTQAGFLRICQWIVDNDIPCVTLSRALDMVNDTSAYVPEWRNCIPNPEFTADLDNSGTPDGWSGTTYAPPPVDDEIKAHTVVAFTWDTETIVYGPEPGINRITFLARSPGEPKTMRLTMTVSQLDAAYQRIDSVKYVYVVLQPDWRSYEFWIDVGQRPERVKLQIDQLEGEVYAAGVSWRRDW